MQWSRRWGCWDQRCHLISKTDLPRPSWLGWLPHKSFFWFGLTEIIPVAHQLIDSVTASTWDFQHYSERHLDSAGDQLPGTGAMWMMFCVIRELIREIVWHRTSDATTGVHVMFHTVPMVSVMFSQSLICCFKNHRTRNIRGLSILSGCFPSGWLSSAGHRLVMGVRCCAWSCPMSSCPVITPSGEYLLIVQWSLRGHPALFTLTPVIMRLKCDRRSSTGDVTAVVTKFVWSLYFE